MGLWSFLGQITDTLPFGQRQKVNKVYLLLSMRR